MAQKLMNRVWIVLAIVLLFSCFTAAAAATNNLTVEKSVSPSQVYPGDQVAWKISLKNNATEPASVVITDTIVNESGDAVDLDSIYVSNSTDSGSFDCNTGKWTIDGIEAGKTVNLTLVTKFAETGTYTNWANITESNITDSVKSDNKVHADVDVIAPTDLTGKIVIKPETLNLKSKGVFTVFVNISGDYDTNEIDLAKSNVTCNGAEAYSLKIAGMGDEDGAFGKIIAKFNRQELKDVSAGADVPITCSGYIQVGSEQIKVEGSDTVHVMNELRTES
ncbi:MAG TPA: DUF11 domain-containing protein, partial [Methanomicrobiales archaeon]|nr:DUF11 domain-containing protein [Methanomicrobiales archaeon]